jgi:hypothetical protein
MIPLAIQGTTRRIGKSQGYAGLCIQDTHLQDGTPVMLSAWEPTPAELASLQAGQPLYLWVLGTGHPPVMLTVDPPSEAPQ